MMLSLVRRQELVIWRTCMHLRLSQMKKLVILEFGGVYGGMTELVNKINRNLTYIVIDFAPILAVMYFGLVNIIDKQINRVTKASPVLKNAVNFIDINDIDSILMPQPDLLIATWSLSESDIKTFDRVVNKNFLFGAHYVLYGYRYNELTNPRQPCSNPIISNHYITQHHELCPWTANKENMYQILKKKHQ